MKGLPPLARLALTGGKTVLGEILRFAQNDTVERFLMVSNRVKNRRINLDRYHILVLAVTERKGWKMKLLKILAVLTFLVFSLPSLYLMAQETDVVSSLGPDNKIIDDAQRKGLEFLTLPSILTIMASWGAASARFGGRWILK